MARNERVVSAETRQRLSEGHKRSHASGSRKPLPFEDLTNQVFGQLKVICTAGHNRHMQRMWKCECSCGATVTVVAGSLKSGNTTKCAACGKAEMGKKLRRNDGETTSERGRSRTLRILYNLTAEDYAAILKFQGGVCPITKKVSRRFVVDHDHADGLIRGVLDWKINRALAHFNDDPDLLRRAADYLSNPTATQALGEAVYGVVGKISRKAKNRRYGPDGTKEPQQRKARTQ